MAPRLVLDRHTLRMIAIAFVLLSGLTIHRLWLADEPAGAIATDVIVLRGETMGTTYEIRIAGKGLTESLRERLQSTTDTRLAEVDRWMSNWNDDSDVSRFNAHRTTEPFPVSHETAAVVAYAIELGKWSGGAFDITVGPLVGLWGFGNRPRMGEPPTEEEIREVQSHMGMRLLRVGRGSPDSGGFLRKNDPAVEIDLSAIAKGYGVDHVADGLFAEGRRNFLVEIGGEVYAAGERPGGGPWRIAVEKPLDDGRAIESVLELQDQAMATSGDYRIFYLEDDERVSHTIDPRTGTPVKNGPASATVLAASATEADAWATTLMVLGDPEGLALAEGWKIPALLLMRGADGEIIQRRNALFPDPSPNERATLTP